MISEACLTALNRLRAFRHRERNSYGLRLDPDIVPERAQEVEATLSQFRGAVLTLFAALKPTDKPARTP